MPAPITYDSIVPGPGGIARTAADPRAISAPNIQFLDPVSGNEMLELLFPSLVPGTPTAPVSILLKNISNPAVTMTNCRLAAKLITGIVNPAGSIVSASGVTVLPNYVQADALAEGAEVIDERWVEVRVGAGAWTPIGGDYGNGAPTANWLSLSNIAPGATQALDVRLNPPLAPATPDIARVRFGLSYAPA